MLSYQHQYHAGNHADVLKHWALLECVKYLQAKERGFDYIDTHAGAGLYQLSSAEATKTAEFEQGVKKVLDSKQACEQLPEYTLFLKQYLDANQYPGSPECVKAHLRPQDRCWLFELHPQTFKQLQTTARRKQIFVRNEDGFKNLNGLLPSPNKRALILIDPSYEIKSDYLTAVDVVVSALKKMPQAMALVWYPVVNQERVAAMQTQFKSSDIKNILQIELAVSSPKPGMYASGLFIVNPPWQLEKTANTVLPILGQALAEDGQERFSCRVLVGE